jgi:hypothetical protein
MVEIVPADKNLPQRGPEISIQAVKEDGTPAGKETIISTYPIVIGRVDSYYDRIEGMSESLKAIRARDGKSITPVDYVVARCPERIDIIEGIFGRYWVFREDDATHRNYMIINKEGDKVTIAYVRKDLFRVKVRDDKRGVYTLSPDLKLVLEKGEKVELRLSGTYTKVGETSSGQWIMEPAWLRIKVLSKDLYNTRS